MPESHPRKQAKIMQFPTPHTRLSTDIRCPLCGQGFLIFEELRAHASQVESRRLIQQALREQHIAQGKLAGAHPDDTFRLPSLPFSASASLSDLLDNSI